MNRRRPREVLRMPGGNRLGVGIGRVERAALPTGATVHVVEAVEGEEQEPCSGAQTIDEVLHALDVAVIDSSGRVMDAAGIEIEQALRILQRVEETLHLRIHLDAAARVAGADQMHVAVEELPRVDSLPRPANQLVHGRSGR